MIMRRSRLVRIAIFLVVASLLSAFTSSATAAPVTDTITVPTGQTSFSIDIYANESTAYAGIEFALAISHESAVTFASFTPNVSGAPLPFTAKNGLHYFGFYANSNAFPDGNTCVGTLYFTDYTGQSLLITVTQMDVVRIVDGKSVKTENESPAFVFSVQRPGAVVTNYTVTFDPAGGTRTGGGLLEQTVPEGGAAVAPVVTRSGFTFDGWDSTFDNITSDLTVTAKWRAASTTSYTVTFDPNGGTRTGGGALVQTVAAGGAATAPIVTRSGYSFDDWDKAFSNVTSDLTVTAKWNKNSGGTDNTGGTVTTPPVTTPAHYFDDVNETHYSWALEAVDALAKAGVVTGTSNRIYSPARNIKRGDFMLMLARAYDIDDAFTENFPDVPTGDYFYDAIGSGKVLGIAKGYGDGTFRPNAPIMRQEMMALIDRTMETIGKPLPRGSESDLAVFSDQGAIHEYARESVAALVKSGIIVGNGGKVNPLGYTTRAEMAVALYRLMQLTESI